MGAGLSATGGNVSPPFHNNSRHLFRIQPQSRRRVSKISRPRPARNHHLRRHACVGPAARPPSAVHPRANSDRARSLLSCFGRVPRGIWLPECAYAAGVENVVQEANIRWFITDTHGVLHANPRPRFGVFAPIFTPNGIAAFGRDLDSAKQVWSRHEGYPGDPRYRDFYRDIGFDLDFD